MKQITLLLITLLSLWQTVFAVESKEVALGKNSKMLQLENKYLTINLLPNAGGRIMGLFFKPAKANLVDLDNGALTDNVWNIPTSKFFLKNKSYKSVERKIDNSIKVEMKGNASGGGIDFLEIGKNITISDDNAAVVIDYSFRNLPQAMTALDYGFWFHNTIGVVGENATYYYPCDNGIIEATPQMQKLSHDRWFHRPSRGWCATAVPNGAGVAMVMDFSMLKCFYSWYGETATTPSLEWRFEKMNLKENETLTSQVTMIPFYGLPTVSGAGQFVVGSLTVEGEEIEADETFPIKISLYSAIKQKVKIDLLLKRNTGKIWKTIATTEMDFKAPATINNFTFNYKVTEDGGYSLEAIIRSGKKELARLNNLLVCSDSDGRYKIAHLKEQKKIKEEKADYTKFDFTSKTPHIKWGKPYCKGKIKVLALTGYQNMREVGELAQRLSIDPHVTFIAVNQRPIFLIGDDYGQTNNADLFDSLNRKLKEKYDVILIGGIPWDYFSQETQGKIINSIKSGTGLVYIDPTSSKNTINKITPIFDPQGVIKGIPSVIKKSFLTNGIPFDLFPASDCRKFKCNGDVLVKVGNSPYLVTSTLGKGKVVALAYKALGGYLASGAGLTPEFRDNYNLFSKLNPGSSKAFLGHYWEYFYSLIAKSVIYASDSLPPVKINSIKSEKLEDEIVISLELSSDSKQSASFNISTYNRYSELLNKQRVKRELMKGNNSISLKIPSLLYAGQQTVNVIIKNKKQQVLNWGTVGVIAEPNVKLTAINLDKNFYNNSENAKIAIIANENISENQYMMCEVFDSYGRSLFREKSNSKNSTFTVPLRNELISRRYTVKAKLFNNDKCVDLLKKDFIVKPSQEKLVWDDFEPGIWLTSKAGLGIRPYLLPQLAEKMHDLTVKTVIANFRSLDVDFATKYSFNPTVLRGIGLDRCAEPKAYLKSGNKLELVRTPCLSNPAFLKSRENAFTALGKKMKNYALRFYWVGDELSITGYSGTPIDFCFSKYCLNKLKEELKKKYETLERLNKEWNTNFADWESVLPMTRQEAWKCKNHNYSPWSDHLNFMDSRLQNILKLAKDACRKHDPTAKVLMSGTQAPTAYGGMDWWRQMQSLSGVMNYSVGGQRELQRSFSPNGDMMHWGVGYSSKGGDVTYNLWEGLFMGDKGVMGFHSPSIINPDMTFSTGAKDALKSLKIITNGIGKHFLNNLKSSSEVAVLYSQASIRAAFINKQREPHSKLRQKYIDLCRNTGINFDFISYEQLANGILDKRKYKALILPNSIALSRGEISEIRKFAKQDNTVIAEGETATMDEHCRSLKRNQLSTIFDNKRCFIDKKINIKYNSAIVYPNTKENAKIIKQEQDLLLKRLKTVGIIPAGLILKNSGKRVRNANMYLRKDSKGNRYVGAIIRDAKIEQVTFKFPKKAHVYELRTGKYKGYTDQVKLFFSSENSYVFTLLDKQPSDLNIELTKQNNLFNININRTNEIDSVVNMQVTDPNGKVISYYQQNILLKDGKGNTKLSFALNDKKGQWILKFKDIVTGQSLTEKISL